jgi:hypothetical protein
LALAAVPAAAVPCAPAPPELAQVMVAEHNAYRREVGVGAIGWSAALACAAQQWADHLMALGGMTLRHSSSAERQGAGENLWAGTAGYYRLRDMVNSWGAERRDYRAGPVTPDNVARVGHYTQMVWQATTSVGCGLARGRGTDILVCRYDPAGNMLGRRPY